MNVASELADYAAGASFETLSAEVVETCRRFTLNTLASALAGTAMTGCEAAVELFTEWGGTPESTVLGSTIRLPAPHAAMMNAMYAQGSDFDDIHDRALVRPFSIVVPAALAVAERIGEVSGPRFITAIAVAADVICRLGLASPLGKLRWARPTTLGTFGAAVAAAKLLNLDGSRILDAIGIAYSQVAGTTQPMIDRALVKRLQPGFAARAGVTAALLAERGISGPANSLSGQNGYFNLYEGGRFEAARITDRLGERNHCVDVGIKPYPCAAEVHGVIDATLAIVARHRISPERIEAIRVCVTPLVFDLGARPYPPADGSVAVAAFVSVGYAVATAIVHGSVGVANYSESAVVDPRALRLVTLTTAEATQGTGSQYFTPATVEIKMSDGQVHRETVTTVRGHPENPMTWDELVSKFRDCCGFAKPAMDSTDVRAIIECVDGLDGIADMRQLARLLSWNSR
jgi:2-methylcitrate dehydratase PrpD